MLYVSHPVADEFKKHVAILPELTEQEIEEQIGEYIFSDIDLQHINATSCGFFCVAWMLWMQILKDKKLAFSNFLNLFNKDTKMNEIILHKLLNQTL